jgi:hypothetical protein
MTRDGEPYSRIYWSATEDPRFDKVWSNDAALALWVRMLIEADASYPLKPQMPRASRSLTVLLDAGLIEAHGSRYTVRGLAKERTRRSERGRKAADARWGRSDDAPAMQTHSTRNAEAMPRRDEKNNQTRQDEQNQPREAGQPLPDENDGATLACRLLPDGGRWLSDREYVAAWDDLDHRFGDWVAEELRAAYESLLPEGRVRAWDLKKTTEMRLAERNRALELAREKARQERDEERVPKTLTPEERERSELARRAVHLWLKNPSGEPVPEGFDALKTWVERREALG